MNYNDVSATKNIVKVSLIGVGMRSHAGIAGRCSHVWQERR